MSVDGMYFAQQSFTCVNCIINAINNLFGESVVTRDTLLKMTYVTKSKKTVPYCETRSSSSGLICQNQIIEHILKLIQKNVNTGITVSPDIKLFFRGSQAFKWYDLQQTLKFAPNQFDSFFKLFHPYILGIYGNRYNNKSGTGIGHAVCIRRSRNYLWLLDSLNSTRRRVSTTKLPMREYNVTPYVVILTHAFVQKIPDIINLT